MLLAGVPLLGCHSRVQATLIGWHGGAPLVGCHCWVPPFSAAFLYIDNTQIGLCYLGSMLVYFFLKFLLFLTFNMFNRFTLYPLTFRPFFFTICYHFFTMFTLLPFLSFTLFTLYPEYPLFDINFGEKNCGTIGRYERQLFFLMRFKKLSCLDFKERQRHDE